ncbi:hypothetical protein EUX98_g8156, partial [Antrodiella citrinella]
IDGFVFEMHSPPSPPSRSSHSPDARSLAFTSPAEIHTLTTTVPLRATQASKEMKRMMGVFRLNPFAVHNGVKVSMGVSFDDDAGSSIGGGKKGKGKDSKDKDEGPCLTWLGEEVGPLKEEPVHIEWQLPGWPTDEDEDDKMDVDVKRPSVSRSMPSVHAKRPEHRPLRRSARHQRVPLPSHPVHPSASSDFASDAALYTLHEDPADASHRWPGAHAYHHHSLDHDAFSVPLFQNDHAAEEMPFEIPGAGSGVVMTPAQGLQWRMQRDAGPNNQSFNPRRLQTQVASSRSMYLPTTRKQSSPSLLAEVGVDFFSQSQEDAWFGKRGVVVS